MATHRSVAKLIGGPKDGAVVLLAGDDCPAVLCSTGKPSPFVYNMRRTYQESLEGGSRLVVEYVHSSLRLDALTHLPG